MSISSGIYFDYNGTAPLRDEAKETLLKTLDMYGNPSAVHAWGRQARQAFEEARARIAHSVGAHPHEVIFTSGGTEASALAMRGVGSFMKAILVSAVEHDSVLKNAPHATIIPVDAYGRVDPAQLSALLENVKPPFLCSIIWGHNETGVLNPIHTLARIIRAKGGILHTDAVQVMGKQNIHFAESGIDLMTLSAHKMGGPAGIGALVVKDTIPLSPLLSGGGQERGMRSGTPNIALACAWAAAIETVEKTREDDLTKARLWQQELENGLVSICPERLVVGEEVSRLPQTTCVTMPHVNADVQLMTFDLEGIAVSSGAACSSGKVQVSPRLLAMGIPEATAKTAIRVSWGWKNQASDFQSFLNVWEKTYRQLGMKRRMVCG